MIREVPTEYLDGIAEVVVSPRTVAHPSRAEVFTMGECVPFNVDGGDPTATQSRVVLYHGSFAALAQLDPQFDWDKEAWDTLVHELRHHVEWRADDHALESFDTAVDANHARLAGEPFDPLFFLDGDEVSPGVFMVDDDCFVDFQVRALPVKLEVCWGGADYEVLVPPGAWLPAYLSVDGVVEGPPGELVLVVRRKARIADFFRKVALFEGAASARRVPTPPSSET